MSPSSLYYEPTLPVLEGLQELEQDAVAKGNAPIESRKVFYRRAASYPDIATTDHFHRFRVFYMACSELFQMNGGQE